MKTNKSRCKDIIEHIKACVDEMLEEYLIKGAV